MEGVYVCVSLRPSTLTLYNGPVIGLGVCTFGSLLMSTPVEMSLSMFYRNQRLDVVVDIVGPMWTSNEWLHQDDGNGRWLWHCAKRTL